MGVGYICPHWATFCPINGRTDWRSHSEWESPETIMNNGVPNGIVKQACQGKGKAVHFLFSALSKYRTIIELRFLSISAAVQEE